MLHSICDSEKEGSIPDSYFSQTSSPENSYQDINIKQYNESSNLLNKDQAQVDSSDCEGSLQSAGSGAFQDAVDVSLLLDDFDKQQLTGYNEGQGIQQKLLTGEGFSKADLKMSLLQLDSDNEDLEDLQDDKDKQSEGLEQIKSKVMRNESKGKKKSFDWKRVTRESDKKKIGRLIGEANMLYAKNQLVEALACCFEAVRLAPNILDPYLTMADIYDSQGNDKRALSCLMIAVHLKPQDVHLWKTLASRSEQSGLKSQAVYCWTKVIKRDKENIDARIQKFQLLKDIGDFKQAIQTIEQLKNLYPLDADMTLELAQLYRSSSQSQAATELLEELITSQYEDIDINHIILLSELYMEIEMYEPTIQLIKQAKKYFSQKQLPCELQVRMGLCLMYMKQYEQASQIFQGLYQDPKFLGQIELIMEISDTYKECGYQQEALQTLKVVWDTRDENLPFQVPQKLIKQYIDIGQYEQALTVSQQLKALITKDNDKYLQACLLLAETYHHTKRPKEAEAALASFEGQLEQFNIISKDLNSNNECNKYSQGSQGYYMVDSSKASAQIELQYGKILLMLGQEEAFLDIMVPILGDTLSSYQHTVDALVNDRQKRKQQKLLSVNEQQKSPQNKIDENEQGSNGKGNEEQESEEDIDLDVDEYTINQGVEKVEGIQQFQNQLVVDNDSKNKADTLFVGQVSQVYKLRQMNRKVGQRGQVSFMDVAQDQSQLSNHSGNKGDGNSSLNEKLTIGSRPQIILKGLFKEQEQFKLLIQVCQVLIQKGRYSHALEMLQAAYELINRSPKWTQRSKRDLIKLMITDCFYYKQDYNVALNHLKLICYRWPSSSVAWNQFCKIYNKLDTTQTWYKLLNPLYARFPENNYIVMMLGNYNLMMQNYEEAIKLYTKAYINENDSSLIPLCLGSSYLAIKLNKKVYNQNKMILIAFTFLQDYGIKRNNIMEYRYNLGRAYQQLGLKDLALRSYCEAIQIYESIHQDADQQKKFFEQQQQGQKYQEQKQQEQQHQEYNIQQERLKYSNFRNIIYDIVYNAVLILKSSGSNELARQLMKKYLVFGD